MSDEALQELKKRLENELEKDMYDDENLLYRFLKARKFEICAAEKMLRDHLEWRKRINFENIQEYKIPEVLEKYLPLIKLGYDKEGNVIRYLPTGNIDWIGLYASCKLEDFEKRVTSMFVEDMNDLQKKSKKSGKIVFIHNLENLAFTQATDKNVIYNCIHLMSTWEKNFPETIQTIFFINASAYFDLFFSLVKKFLPSEFLKKIVLYSDDKWKEDLLKIIDPEILPAFLGGKRTDPDGNTLCLTFINHGEPVSEKYFIHRSKRSLSTEQNVKKIILQNASFQEVILEVKQPGSYFEWEFQTESRDVGFGLFYEDEKENKTELVPIQRINTDEYSESGLYKCENAGSYIVVFDNTYSLIRSKTVYYKIKVLSSEEAESHLLK